MEKPYFLIDTEAGICSQEEFNHDFRLLRDHIAEKDLIMANRAYRLVRLAIERGYKIPW